jgi:hypothetical protein
MAGHRDKSTSLPCLLIRNRCRSQNESIVWRVPGSPDTVRTSSFANHPPQAFYHRAWQRRCNDAGARHRPFDECD